MFKILIILMIFFSLTLFVESKEPIKCKATFNWNIDTLCLSLSIVNNTNKDVYIPFGSWDVDGLFGNEANKTGKPYPYFVNQIFFSPKKYNDYYKFDFYDYPLAKFRFPKFLVLHPKKTNIINFKFIEFENYITKGFDYNFIIHTPYLPDTKLDSILRIINLQKEEIIIDTSLVTIYFIKLNLADVLLDRLFWEYGDLQYINFVKQYQDTSEKALKDFFSRHTAERFKYKTNRIITKSEEDSIIMNFHIDFIRTIKKLKKPKNISN